MVAKSLLSEEPQQYVILHKYQRKIEAVVTRNCGKTNHRNDLSPQFSNHSPQSGADTNNV
jgi:hypothetical protein